MKPELVFGGMSAGFFLLILTELAAATVNLRESRIRDVGWLKNIGVSATPSFYSVSYCCYISFLPSQKSFFLVDMFKRAGSTSKPEQMLLIFARYVGDEGNVSDMVHTLVISNQLQMFPVEPAKLLRAPPEASL